MRQPRCSASPSMLSMLRGLAGAAKNETAARRGAPGRGCAIARAAAAATAAGAPAGREHPWSILLITWDSARQPAGLRPSEARLGVEPVLRGGGVHGDRTPVRGQGKVGPTVQPQLWGYPLEVPVPAPFQLSYRLHHVLSTAPCLRGRGGGPVGHPASSQI